MNCFMNIAINDIFIIYIYNVKQLEYIEDQT